MWKPKEKSITPPFCDKHYEHLFLSGLFLGRQLSCPPSYTHFYSLYFSSRNNMLGTVKLNSKVLDLWSKPREADRPEKAAPGCGWESLVPQAHCSRVPTMHGATSPAQPSDPGCQRKKAPPRIRGSVPSCMCLVLRLRHPADSCGPLPPQPPSSQHRQLFARAGMQRSPPLGNEEAHE